MRILPFILVGAWIASLGWFSLPSSVCVAQQSSEKSEPIAAYAPRRIPSDLLPNAMWVHEALLSGGLPNGEAAFEELSRLGIRTIISVDGIQPDVNAASKYAMRYVHLPHGYDGIARQRQLELAKAIRELPKPIYIHCHHGRHRSPAAAATTCVNLGWLPPEAGPAILKEAGTNPSYRGLYECVAKADRIEPSQLDDLPVDFQPIADLPPLVDSMVAMDAVLDRIKEYEKHLRNPPTALAPEGNPLPDAFMLKEYYTELHRSGLEERREPAFLQFLGDGTILAEELEQRLIAIRGRLNPSSDALDQARTTMQRLQKNCSQCHSQFRDNLALSSSK